MASLTKKKRARRRRSFRRHLGLMTRPIVLSLVAVGIWFTLWKHGICFPTADREILTNALIPTLGITFSITAAVVLNAIWDQYRHVAKSILFKDQKMFLMYRDERIPMMFHILLASFSLPLLGAFMLLPYDGLWSGAVSVFSATFGLALYWVVAIELDNPIKSVWFAERIPPEWMSLDIDEVFDLSINGAYTT